MFNAKHFEKTMNKAGRRPWFKEWGWAVMGGIALCLYAYLSFVTQPKISAHVSVAAREYPIGPFGGGGGEGF